MAGSDQLRKLLAQATTIAQLGLPASLAIDLIYRILFTEGDVSVARLAEVTRLFPQVIDEIMADMQHDHMVEVVKAGTHCGSVYTYRLTDEGAARARDAMERTQYIGPFPVDIEAYRKAIVLQTAERQKVTPAEVKQALSQLDPARKFSSPHRPGHQLRFIAVLVWAARQRQDHGRAGHRQTAGRSRSDLAAVRRLDRRADHSDSRSAGARSLSRRRT